MADYINRDDGDWEADENGRQKREAKNEPLQPVEPLIAARSNR